MQELWQVVVGGAFIFLAVFVRSLPDLIFNLIFRFAPIVIRVVIRVIQPLQGPVSDEIDSVTKIRQFWSTPVANVILREICFQLFAFNYLLSIIKEIRIKRKILLTQNYRTASQPPVLPLC